MQSKHEGWRDLHAEAEALIEEVSTKAEGHRKPDAPAAWPKRDRRSVAAQTVRPVPCLQQATHKLTEDASSAAAVLSLCILHIACMTSGCCVYMARTLACPYTQSLAPAAWPKRDRRSAAVQTVRPVPRLQGATHTS